MINTCEKEKHNSTQSDLPSNYLNALLYFKINKNTTMTTYIVFVLKHTFKLRLKVSSRNISTFNSLFLCRFSSSDFLPDTTFSSIHNSSSVIFWNNTLQYTYI